MLTGIQVSWGVVRDAWMRTDLLTRHHRFLQPLRLGLALHLEEERAVKVQTILGDNRCEYCGRPDKAPPANSFLQLEQIEHRTTKVGKPRSNGFRERFHPDAPIKSISKSRAGPPDLGTYNTRRPHRCRGMESRTPYEV